MLVGRDRSLRNGSIHQNRSPRWVGPRGLELVSVGQQALAPAKVWKSGRDRLEVRLPCRSKIVQDSNQRFGTQRLAHVPNTPQWSQHRSGTRFQHSARSATTRSVAPLTPSRTPKQIGNTRAACRGVVDQASADPAVRKRMTGKSMIDVFGESGFVAKAANHSGLPWLCARHEV